MSDRQFDSDVIAQAGEIPGAPGGGVPPDPDPPGDGGDGGDGGGGEPTDPGSTPENGTDTGGNETVTEPGGPGSTPDGGDGVVDFPDPWEAMTDVIAGFIQSLAEGVAGLVDQFNRTLLTLPASGDPAAPETWFLDAVNDPFWIAVAILYLMCTGLAMPFVWGVGWFNVAFPRGQSRNERVLTLFKATVLIGAGWFLLMLWLHLWNEAILAFAPDGGEFLATPSDTTKLGLGIVVGGAILILKSVIILAGILVHAAFIILTYLLVGTWPLAVALHYTDMIGVKPLGTSAVVAVLLLSPLYFMRALLLRLLFELPIAGGSVESLTSLLLMIAGVLIAFVGIPYYGLQNLLPHTVVGAALGAGNKGKRSLSTARERAPSAGELRERITTVRGSESDSSISQYRNSRGSSLQARSRNAEGPEKVTLSGHVRIAGTQSGDTRSRSGDTRTRTRRSSSNQRSGGN